MSTDRRWDQRRFTLEESTTINNGARTVFIEHMTPGTSVPPHVHYRFAETFDLISGSMSVFSSDTPDLDALQASAQPVEIGKQFTVPPGKYHNYEVGNENTVLRVIVMPGDADFERLLKILNGLAADGELEKMGNSVVLMAVIFGLSDAHPIGPVEDMLNGVKQEKREEIERLRKELLEKYDTEEGLRRLLQQPTYA